MNGRDMKAGEVDQSQGKEAIFVLMREGWICLRQTVGKRHLSRFQWTEPAQRPKLWDPCEYWLRIGITSFVLLDPWRSDIGLLEHSVVICIVNFRIGESSQGRCCDGFWCPVAVCSKK